MVDNTYTNYIKRQKRAQKEIFINILIWFTLICSTIVLAATCKNQYDTQLLINTYSKHYIDSLNGKIFQQELRLKRYDYILDLIEEMPDKKCRNKIDSIIKNTE